jgi:hypothetical protein
MSSVVAPEQDEQELVVVEVVVFPVAVVIFVLIPVDTEDLF